MVQTAEARGLMTCGYHTDQAPLAPKGYLTGAEWNWTYLYPKWIGEMQGRYDHAQLHPRRLQGAVHQELGL